MATPISKGGVDGVLILDGHVPTLSLRDSVIWDNYNGI